MGTVIGRIDTVVGKIDSVLVKNIGLTDNCVASHNVSTNGYDVMIVFSICITCIILGLILLVYFILKNKNINSLKKQVEDKERTSSEITATLKERKLKFLEECTKDVENKRINSDASQKFLSYIDELIEVKKQGNDGNA